MIGKVVLSLGVVVGAQVDSGGACAYVAEIWRCVAGEAAPTIVLNAGSRLTSATWTELVPELSELGTILTFDRPGLGRSAPRGGERSPARIAAEIDGLVASLDRDGPMVLVGHSSGGYAMLRLAAEQPERVLAVVLVDTPHPDFETERRSLLDPGELVERDRLLRASRAEASAAVRAEYAAAERPGALRFDDVPRDLDLVVISADLQDFGDLGTAAAHRELWLRLQRRWLELSDRSRLVIAHGSGHMVHRERPDLLVRVIGEILGR